MPGRIGTGGRTARRFLVLSSLAMVLALVFGASLAIAQGRVILPWSAHTSGGDDLTSLRHKMRAVTVGQSAIGISKSDEFQVELGFLTGVRAGPAAFATLAANLALTPTATPEPPATETPTAETPTAEPTADPAVPTETPEVTASETPKLVPTVRPPTATATRRPRPTPTSVPRPTATGEPIVIVVTSPPGPSPTSEPTPAAPAAPPTPLVIVVTSVPPSAPDVPESPVGGLCSAPRSHGPFPLDLGLLMILASPFALWRLNSRS